VELDQRHSSTTLRDVLARDGKVGGEMIRPRTFYLTKFSKGYRSRRWWDDKGKSLAKRFLQLVKKNYGVRGRVIKVKETK